jgi:nucleoid-associated protein YgaU
MPEPVIILRQAGEPADQENEPAAPAAGGVDSIDAANGERAPAESGPPSSKRLIGSAASWLLKTAAAVLQVAVIAVFHVARTYPRHSLAAGLSLAILAAIWIAEHRSGTAARGPVTGQIGGAATGKTDRTKDRAGAHDSPSATKPGTTVQTVLSNPASPRTDSSSLPKAPPPAPLTAPDKGEEPPLPSLVNSPSAGGLNSSNPSADGGSTAQSLSPAPRPTAEPGETNPSITVVDAAPKPSVDGIGANNKKLETPAPAPQPLAPSPGAAATLLGSPPAALPPPTDHTPLQTASSTELPGLPPKDAALPPSSPSGEAKSGETPPAVSGSNANPAIAAPGATEGPVVPSATGDNVIPVRTANDGSAPPLSSADHPAPAGSGSEGSTSPVANADHPTPSPSASVGSIAAGGSGDQKAATGPSAAQEPESKAVDHPIPPAGNAVQNLESTTKDKMSPTQIKTGESKPDEPPLGSPSTPSTVDVPTSTQSSPATDRENSTPKTERDAAEKNAPRLGGDPPSGVAANSSTSSAQQTGPPEAFTPIPIPIPTATGIPPSIPLGARPSAPSGHDAAATTQGTDQRISQASPPSSGDPVPPSRSPRDVPSEGWVVISNTGKLPTDGTDNPEPAASDSIDPRDAVRGSRVAADDSQSHTAKGVKFDLPSQESRPRPQRGTDRGNHPRDTGTGSVAETPATAGALSSRVESVPHVVERDENFWTISRLYYNSGRYYRALWKANADKYPEIGELHVGDVIVVPPMEDLDRAYFVTARTDPASPPARANTRRGQTEDKDDATSAIESPLPSSVVRSVSRRERSTGRNDKGVTESDQDTAEPEVQTPPRADRGTGKSGPATRLVYKVRTHDTLRSIARDTLGDANRSTEILELNRELIDDPGHLPEGKVLTLPDDARTGSYRSASRR